MFDCYCDYEPSAVWIEKKVRARKPWKCGECGGAIKAGEVYHRVKSLYDGDWSTLRRCGDCMVIACDLDQATKAHGGCVCNLWGGMVEEMLELKRESHPAELKILHPIYAAFNAASRERGGHQFDLGVFSS